MLFMPEPFEELWKGQILFSCQSIRIRVPDDNSNLHSSFQAGAAVSLGHISVSIMDSVTPDFGCTHFCNRGVNQYSIIE